MQLALTGTRTEQRQRRVALEGTLLLPCTKYRRWRAFKHISGL